MKDSTVLRETNTLSKDKHKKRIIRMSVVYGTRDKNIQIQVCCPVSYSEIWVGHQESLQTGMLAGRKIYTRTPVCAKRTKAVHV